MKKKLLLFCLLCLPHFLSAQEKELRIATDLGIGQEFLLDHLSVKFLEVISDSRCPEQVTCIWPGEAKVLLGIRIGGRYFEKEVTMSGSGAEFALSEDLKMMASQLRPYPKTPAGIAPEEYCVTFATVVEQKD